MNVDEALKQAVDAIDKKVVAHTSPSEAADMINDLLSDDQKTVFANMRACIPLGYVKKLLLFLAVLLVSSGPLLASNRENMELSGPRFNWRFSGNSSGRIVHNPVSVTPTSFLSQNYFFNNFSYAGLMGVVDGFVFNERVQNAPAFSIFQNIASSGNSGMTKVTAIRRQYSNVIPVTGLKLRERLGGRKIMEANARSHVNSWGSPGIFYPLDDFVPAFIRSGDPIAAFVRNCYPCSVLCRSVLSGNGGIFGRSSGLSGFPESPENKPYTNDADKDLPTSNTDSILSGTRHPSLLSEVEGFNPARFHGSMAFGVFFAGLGGWIAGWGLYRARRWRRSIFVSGIVFGLIAADLGRRIFVSYIYDWFILVF